MVDIQQVESHACQRSEERQFELAESRRRNWLYWSTSVALYAVPGRIALMSQGPLRSRPKATELPLQGTLTRKFEPIDDIANRQPILDEERSNDHSETWKSMEALLTTGKVRSIGMYLIITWLTWWGVSNFNLSQLQKLLETANVPPAVNQIEIHP